MILTGLLACSSTKRNVHVAKGFSLCGLLHVGRGGQWQHNMQYTLSTADVLHSVTKLEHPILHTYH